MYFLCGLPKWLSVPVLTDWLPTKDFVVFDSAVTNKIVRAIYLAYVKEYGKKFGKALFPATLVLPINYKVFDWAKSRDVDLSTLNNVKMDGVVVAEEKGWFGSTQTKLKTYSKHFKTVEVVGVKGCEQFKTALPELEQLTEVKFLELREPKNLELHKAKLLQVANFYGCVDLAESDVVKIVTQCTNLTDLNLHGCKFMKQSLVTAIIVHGRNIECLNLSCCYSIDKHGIRRLVFHMKKLVEFTRDHMSDFSVRQLICYRGKQLRKVTCNQSVKIASGDTDFMSDNTLIAVTSSCEHLTSFNISECVSISDKALTHLASVLSCLLVINLQDVPLITSATLVAISQSNPHLREVFLRKNHQVDEVGLRSFGTNCKELVKIHLIDMKLEDSTLSYIASECVNIEELNVSVNATLSNRVMIEIAPFLHRLKVLNISQCKALTDVTLIAFAAYCFCLKDVNLDGDTLMTMKGIGMIVGCCPNLKKLSYLDVKLGSIWAATSLI